MARTVFIFGAGASAAAEAPLMSDFFEAIEDLYEVGESKGLMEEHLADFKLVINGFYELDKVNVKTRMGYHENIEELFGTFEMARILKRFGNFTSNEIDNLVSAIKRVIRITIEQKMKFSHIQDVGISSPAGYGDFVSSLDGKWRVRDKPQIAFITMNYDIGLEFALAKEKIEYDYCFDGPRKAEKVPLLKLHGSLNWSRCKKCLAVLSLSIPDWLPRIKVGEFFGYDVRENHNRVGLNVTGKLATLKHDECGAKVEPEPFIVPPTWNKTEYRQRIAPVWQQAARELSEARNIFIIGYSLPETDQFFRHLLALSLSGGPAIRKLVFLSPDNTAYSRLERFLGDQVAPKAYRIPTKFEHVWSYPEYKSKMNFI